MMLTSVRDTVVMTLMLMLFYIMIYRVWNDGSALVSCLPKRL